MRTLFAAPLFAAAVVSGPAAAAPDYGHVVSDVVEQHAKPAYGRLVTSTSALAKTLADTCGKTEGAAAGRAAYHKAMDDWETIQHIRSGPAAEANRHARMMFWPDERAIVTRQMNRFLANGTEQDLKDLSGGSVALQGFPALERIIYGKAPLATEPAKGLSLSHCSVAVAIGHNIAATAKEMQAAASAPDPFGTDTKEAARMLFGDLVTALQVTYQLKLRAPAGEEGKTRARLAESWRSKRSLLNVKQNLTAMKDFYARIYGPGGEDDPAHQLILSQFDVAVDTAERLGKSVESALGQKNGRLQIRALAATIDDIKNLIAEKLTEHLDVNLGFNALDGD